MDKIKVYQRLTIKLKDGSVAHFMGPAYQWPEDAEIDSVYTSQPMTLPDGVFLAEDGTGHFQLMINKSALACPD